MESPGGMRRSRAAGLDVGPVRWGDRTGTTAGPLPGGWIKVSKTVLIQPRIGATVRKLVVRATVSPSRS